MLIGPTDQLLQDMASILFDATLVSKVSAHGNLVNTIVSGGLPRRSTLCGTFFGKSGA